ncbi:putative holin-like toxin [Cohnella phaseoli]
MVSLRKGGSHGNSRCNHNHDSFGTFIIALLTYIAINYKRK